MFTDVERYLNFIIENKLTQAQFLFLYLIYRKKVDCIKKYKAAFPNEENSMIGKYDKQDLLDRGFIESVGEAGMTADYILGEKFTKLFLKDVFNATEEFVKEYPGFVQIQGKAIPLITMDRYKLANIYGERIDYSVEEHLEVVKDVKFARAKDMLSSSIENFVRGEVWQKIRPIRLNQESIKEVNLTFDEF